MPNIFYNKVGQHYLIGKRIRLLYTNDPYTRLKQGDLGTITDINECGSLIPNPSSLTFGKHFYAVSINDI
jgi:hypothetical protein